MPQESFPRFRAGDPIRADNYDRLQDVVAGLARAGGVAGDLLSVQTSDFRALTRPAVGRVHLVEMVNHLLYVKEPYLDSEDGLSHTSLTGPFLAGVPAQVIIYDRSNQWWVRTGVNVLVEGYSGSESPLAAGEQLHVIYNPSTGMYVPVRQLQVRHAVTVRTYPEPLEVDAGADPAEATYPDQADDPNVYAVNFVKLRYKEQPGRQELSLEEMPVPDDPPLPHAYAYSHSGVYIPEGSLITVYFLDGQWHTWATVEAASGSAHGSAKVSRWCFPVVVDVRCTATGWEKDVIYVHVGDDGRIVDAGDTPCPPPATHTPCEVCPGTDPGDTVSLDAGTFGDGACTDCAAAGGVRDVSRGPSGGCTWKSASFTLCGAAGAFWNVFASPVVLGGPMALWVAELILADGEGVVRYELSASDCSLPATLTTKAYDTGRCVTPASVTIGAGGGPPPGQPAVTAAFQDVTVGSCGDCANINGLTLSFLQQSTSLWAGSSDGPVCGGVLTYDISLHTSDYPQPTWVLRLVAPGGATFATFINTTAGTAWNGTAITFDYEGDIGYCHNWPPSVAVSPA